MRVRPNTAGNVNLHIEGIVLEGFSFTGAETARFQRSVERELTALVRKRGIAARSSSEASVSAPMCPSSFERDPARLGRQIARSIFDCLNPDL